jgi:phage/plasmid primase-like uncharacterized protein
MVDITRIIGGAWTPAETPRIDPPDVQIKDAMILAGITPPDDIIFDGKIHRFRSGTKGTPGQDKSGWYVVYGDGVPAGRFGCWRAGFETPWRADVGRTLSVVEEMAYTRRIAEAKAAREAEQAQQREVAAATVETIWTGASGASAEHPYLARKGIKPHGARVTGDGRLVVPLYGPDGALSSLQYISHEGSKLYHPGGQTGGKLWVIGTTDEAGPIFIAEGFATAATIHEATGRPCAVAYSASNLPAVAESLRAAHGAAQDLVVVADQDASGTGQRYAELASAKAGARFVMPPAMGDANDFVLAGGDLVALLMPPVESWLVHADDFSAQPAPIAWLIKGWVQDHALMMLHGPSGGGKTFVILDWFLRMTSGIDTWCGHRVKPCSAVYLAGEGHHGLRGRIAAWKHKHGIKSLDLWLSKDGCDLNTPAGLQKVIEQIRRLPKKPDVIGVDTLHRFLAGDENSAQDAKTMLDACAALIREFQCTVILVHHTGNADEAQHRARGSSAWRGALDIEVSIIPAKDGQPMQVVQRKSKDAELADPIYMQLESVEIPGWIDEDGEQVSSAVAVQVDAPEPQKKFTKEDNKIHRHKSEFKSAWYWALERQKEGAAYPTEKDNAVYVSRESMINYLAKEKLGKGDRHLKRSTAEQYVKSSASGQTICELIKAEILSEDDDGWVVIDGAFSSELFVSRQSR